MHIGELFELTGKVAIVTGGSRGIGEEIAIGLGEAGAKVAITARRDEWLKPALEKIAAMGIDCISIKADVAQAVDVKNLVDEVASKWGRIDILVNNAGITWGTPPEDMAIDKWDSVLDTNAKGTLLCCQYAGKVMMKQNSGNIINVSSSTGILAVDPNIMQAIGYQASKAAVAIMTKQLAVEWARYNIRVNGIAPFFFDTRMTHGVLKGAEPAIIQHVPMRRVGRAGEIKGAIVFLASEASSYITGQTILIDGGMSAW